MKNSTQINLNQSNYDFVTDMNSLADAGSTAFDNDLSFELNGAGELGVDSITSLEPQVSSNLGAAFALNSNDFGSGEPFGVESSAVQQVQQSGVDSQSLGDIQSSFSNADLNSQTDAQGNFQLNFDSTDDAGFDIDFVFDENITDSQKQAFEQAAARWESIITGDIPSITIPGLGEVDDIVINVRSENVTVSNEVAGSGTVAEAVVDLSRNEGNLPIQSTIRLDPRFVDQLETGELLESVATHEIGHALGFTNSWGVRNLLSGNTYTGAGAVAEYNKVFGVNETSIPLAARNGHWQEELFGNELMTASFDTASDPLSSITIASFGDLGYEVDLSAADPFTPPEPMAMDTTNI